MLLLCDFLALWFSITYLPLAEEIGSNHIKYEIM